MDHDRSQGRVEAVECGALLARLSEFLDGELPPELCREIEAHMADCGPCRDVIETLRRTVDLCRALPRRELPEEARAAIRALLRESFPRPVDR